MTETAMGGPMTPSPARSKRDFPSFVREPGIGSPPDHSVQVPTEAQALAALQRYRKLPTPEDNDIVQRWIAAAKGDPTEYARRIHLTK